MIAYLKGKIIEIENNKIILLTQYGVGYEIFISNIVLQKISQDNEVNLYIYHHITENSQSLFGFLEKIEKEIFEELIKISGIGGKVAIQILSLGINNLTLAITKEDKKMIESIKGIGKKMAEKIILELKDKDFIKNNVLTSNIGETKKENNIEIPLKNDIITTLVNMGYNKIDIEKALLKIDPKLTEMQLIIPAIIKEL